MSYGFTLWNANGTVAFDSNGIGWLYIDDFLVTGGAAAVTKTYANLGTSTINVNVAGVSTMNANATVTQGVSGADATVTVSSTRNARVRVMVE